MTQEEYEATNWHRGNVVRLTNGKEYPVKKVKKRYLLLYSYEYCAYFLADYMIIDCRTSDYVDDTPKQPRTPLKIATMPKHAPGETAAPAEGAAPAKRKRARIQTVKTVSERVDTNF